MSQQVMSLTAPVGVASAGVAAVVACVTRWWLLGDANGPVAIATGAACGALTGALLTQLLRNDDSRIEAEASLVVVSIGALAGGFVTLTCDPALTVAGVFAGVFMATAMLPLLSALARYARRARRSRARSLVGGVDRRGPWLATSGALAVSALFGSVSAKTFNTSWTTERIELVAVPLVVALIATTIAVSILGLDMSAERRARGLCARHDLREGGSIAVTNRTVDVGIGGERWVEPSETLTSYRTIAEERVAVLGDVLGAPSVLEAAVHQSSFVAILAASSLVVSFVAFAFA